MFAKVFEQIFDSSIAEDWKVRLVFEDLLILADINGVVDKTHEAIARRTNVPLDVVVNAIHILEQPDPKTRRPDADGRRIVRLDEHRDWGWLIVNYEYYRNIASEEQKRQKTKERVRKFREKHSCNADVTLVNDSPSAYASSSVGESEGMKESFERCWKAYPDKSGSKHKALQAYKQAKPKEEDVMAGIARYKAHVENQRNNGFRELKYANGQTWFNQRRWESEYEVEKSKPIQQKGLCNGAVI